MGGDDGGACRGGPGVIRRHAGGRGSAYTDHTHPLPCSDKSCNTDHETDSRQNSPATSSVAESDQDSGNDTTNDTTDTETTSEDDTRAVTVADGPANEVGVSLVTK